jgi:hypothetical protein
MFQYFKKKYENIKDYLKHTYLWKSIKKTFQILDTVITQILEPIFNTTYWFLWIIYLFLLFGIVYINPANIAIVSKISELIIAIVLIVKFNSFREIHTLSNFERRLIFASAILLLINLGVKEYILNTIEKNKFLNQIPMVNEIVAIEEKRTI